VLKYPASDDSCTGDQLRPWVSSDRANQRFYSRHTNCYQSGRDGPPICKRVKVDLEWTNCSQCGRPITGAAPAATTPRSLYVCAISCFTCHHTIQHPELHRLSTHQALLICLMCRANCVLVVCRLRFYCPGNFGPWSLSGISRSPKHGVQIGRLAGDGSDLHDIELIYNCSRHNGFIRRRPLVAASKKDSKSESANEGLELLITGPWCRLINLKTTIN